MNIYYGTYDKAFDVTDACKLLLKDKNTITIPRGDGERAKLFGDPNPGFLKRIIVKHNGKTSEYNETIAVSITLPENIAENEVENRLKHIHSNLKMKYGNFYNELPEQKMAVRYLTGNEKVLELGANVGRNSLIIGSIVNQNHFVTLECDALTVKQLTENRDVNNMQFHIEHAALSNRKLIQKGWDTKPSEVLEAGYQWVNTITLDALRNKYNIDFDTLVLDCEGAFYYILTDMPDILNNIKLIIMENDYHDITHKNYIDAVLKQNGFHVEYSEAGGWGPCSERFFEVWKRNILQN